MSGYHGGRKGSHYYIMLCIALWGWLLTNCSGPSTPPVSNNHTSPSTTYAMVQPYAGAINRPVITTGCGQTSQVRPGSSVNVTIAAHPAVSNGRSTRTYLVHIPASYEAKRPQAVVLIFHGHGGTSAGMERSTGFSQLGDQQDFIAVYPQGLLQGMGGSPFWADIGPIDYGIDDVLFVSDVLNDLQAKFCVDSRRIYATGFSNGGGMTNFLACRLAGRIAAFAPVSGDSYAMPTGCHPGRSVSILDFHGTADPVVHYNGVSLDQNPAWPLPSIPQWLQGWATRDGCTHGPAIFLREPGVTGEQWTGCQGNAVVAHYRIEGGGHAWPPTIGGRSGAAVMWSFFQSHPLPGV